METLHYKGYEIKIERDDFPQNPLRDWDGHVLFCLNHKRYDLHNNTDFDTNEFESWEAIREAIEDEYCPLAILSVFMYDHGGITIKTSPFICCWDSSQIGFAFIDIPTLKQWGLRAGDKTAKELEEMIRDNVRLYDDYLTGNVFGYSIADSSGNTLDSCYGYYGDLGKEDMIGEAKSNDEHYLRQKIVKHAIIVKRWIRSQVPLIYRQSIGQIHFYSK